MWAYPTLFHEFRELLSQNSFDTSHYHHLSPNKFLPKHFPCTHLPEWHLKAPSTQPSPDGTCHLHLQTYWFSLSHAMWLTIPCCPAPNLQGLCFVLFISYDGKSHGPYLYWDITPKHPTFHPVPLASSAVLVYNHRNDLQHLTLNSPGSLLQLSLRQEGGRAQPLKECQPEDVTRTD